MKTIMVEMNFKKDFIYERLIRRLIYASILVCAVIIIYFIASYPGYRMTGWAAKQACSLINITGQSLSQVKAELIEENKLFKLVSLKWNPETGAVRASVFGLFPNKAIYRPPLGAVLIFPGYENKIKSFPKPELHLSSAENRSCYPFKNDHKVPVGVDKSKLKKVLTYAFEGSLSAKKLVCTRAVLVMWKNQVIAEQYAPGFSRKSLFISWSMAKSVLNLAIGRRVYQGAMSLNATGLFPVWSNDKRNSISLEQLLRMESGLRWYEPYTLTSDVVTMLCRKPDMGNYAASFKRTEDNPPAHFYYSSGTSNILSLLLRRSFSSDRDYVNFLWNDFLLPLGISDAQLEFDASGTWIGATYFYATARDWARLGQFVLNDGVLNGHRLIPEGWIKRTIKPTLSYHSSTITNDPLGMSYGMHWWINKKNDKNENWMNDVPNDAIIAWGHYGQYLMIIPSRRLIIVRLGQEKENSWDENHFVRLILAALPDKKN
ncbi:MAG: serine hydrolase [Lentisphaerae bacterium]|nr:serine hydrolase [Lentisphaerota bacterium]MCP4103395.1 serine hydrolase [Lentisphaerota bacterium]